MIPKHLSHKPIVAIDNYEQFDGHFANNTDTRSLSIGHAQYDSKDISCKVFRHTDSQWSPQSEELPPHRCIDLCNLLVQSFLIASNATPKGTTVIPTIVDESGIKDIEEFYKVHSDKVLVPKLRELKKLLDQLNI